MFGYYCPMAGELEGVAFDGEELQGAKFHITMGLYEARLDKLTEIETALTEAGVPTRRRCMWVATTGLSGAPLLWIT